MLVQRREVGGEIVRQHGKVLDAGVHGGAIRGGMPIDRRSLGYAAIHVGDADTDADGAVWKALGNFDLIQIARRVVVDGRPEQAAQIAYRGIGSRLRRMRAQGRDLPLHFGRKVRSETFRDHLLACQCRKVVVGTLQVGHE